MAARSADDSNGNQLAFDKCFRSLDLLQFLQDYVVERPDLVVLFKKRPADDALSVEHERGGLRDFSFRVIEVIGVNDLVAEVRQKRERDLELSGKRGALFGVVHADGNNICARSLQLVVVSGQTG